MAAATPDPQYRIPDSLGDNPFPRTDERYKKWDRFAREALTGLGRTVEGLVALKAVIADENPAQAYREWRVQNPQSHEEYDAEKVAELAGPGGVSVFRDHVDRLVLDAFIRFTEEPQDFAYCVQIVKNFCGALAFALGIPPHDQRLEKWRNLKLDFAREYAADVKLPRRRWTIDPYNRGNRSNEKRLTPLIVQLMATCGREFEHDRQAVDECLDSIEHRGLTDEDEVGRITFIGEALVELCEQLSLSVKREHRDREAEVLQLLRAQFLKHVHQGFLECSAFRIAELSAKPSFHTVASKAATRKFEAKSETVHGVDDATLHEPPVERRGRPPNEKVNADALRTLRKSATDSTGKRFTQERFAEESGLSLDDIKRGEKGLNWPEDKFAKAAAALARLLNSEIFPSHLKTSGS
jgi:hypothetical protein